MGVFIWSYGCLHLELVIFQDERWVSSSGGLLFSLYPRGMIFLAFGSQATMLYSNNIDKEPILVIFK